MVICNEYMLEMARALPIPVPWNRDAFIANIAEKRRRAIKLIPTDTAALVDSPCGLWLARDEEDLILHQIGTSDYHVDQIVCHEIGHMLLGHGQTPTSGTEKAHQLRLCRQLLPDINPETVHAVLGRTDYADHQERDAEMFASILMIVAAEASDQKSMMRNAFFRRR